MYKYILSYMLADELVFGTFSLENSDRIVKFEDIEAIRSGIAKNVNKRYSADDVILLNILEFKNGVLCR